MRSERVRRRPARRPSVVVTEKCLLAILAQGSRNSRRWFSVDDLTALEAAADRLAGEIEQAIAGGGGDLAGLDAVARRLRRSVVRPLGNARTALGAAAPAREEPPPGGVDDLEALIGDRLWDLAQRATRLRLDRYEGQGITVTDNRGTCAHSGFCTDRLPIAFRVDREPFVAAAGARMDELLRAVRACPSGALGAALQGLVDAREDLADQVRDP